MLKLVILLGDNIYNNCGLAVLSCSLLGSAKIAQTHQRLPLTMSLIEVNVCATENAINESVIGFSHKIAHIKINWVIQVKLLLFLMG